MVGTGNDHVTGAVIPRDVDRRARMKTVNHSKLHIRMVN